MDQRERAAEIDRLRQCWSDATARQARLVSEGNAFAATIGEHRKKLGNPFFYSGKNHGRAENADESAAKYTGYKSHEAGLSLVRGFSDVRQELSALREKLRGLGVIIE
jgi:hypothetical protein